MRVLKAMDACSSVKSMGELHSALRDRKHERNALDSEGKSDSKLSKVPSVDMSISY